MLRTEKTLVGSRGEPTQAQLAEGWGDLTQPVHSRTGWALCSLRDRPRLQWPAQLLVPRFKTDVGIQRDQEPEQREAEPASQGPVHPQVSGAREDCQSSSAFSQEGREAMRLTFQGDPRQSWTLKSQRSLDSLLYCLALTLGMFTSSTPQSAHL